MLNVNSVSFVALYERLTTKIQFTFERLLLCNIGRFFHYKADGKWFTAQVYFCRHVAFGIWTLQLYPLASRSQLETLCMSYSLSKD